MNPKVDTFLDKAKKWGKEFEKLRKIMLDCGLTEEFKWKHPCYTSEGRNIVLIHGFKEYCALLFFKGSILKDSKGILVQQTKNVKAARQIRFSNAGEIDKMKSTIKEYVYEAVEVEKAGLDIKLKTTSDYKIPEELKTEFDKNSAFKTAFYNLTPGRQRGFILYFSQPKKSSTRESRIEKCMDGIFNGKGLNDWK